MPTTQQHLDQASANEVVSTQINQEDWAVTALFYAAVHYVEAYCCHAHGVHSKGHHDRQVFVGNNLSAIGPEYAGLEFWSREARYECCEFSTHDVQSLRADLQKIKDHILPMIT